MALVSMRQLLDHAAEQGYGVPAQRWSSACAQGAQVRPSQRDLARIDLAQPGQDLSKRNLG